ncbi:MAG TPA: DUF2510 domain-containing protein [Mycobacteriales bacterium]|nr:DUF2510 domain-containing protein [Mycobacteriales bacterium]
MSDVQPPTDAQPPAGWYPDPSDATQQRYWDGSTWTGHTAASGATAAVPTGPAVAAGAALPTGMPSWQMPAGGTSFPAQQKKPWWKLKRVWIPALVVVALIIIGAVASGGGDHSNALEKSILQNGQKQLQDSVSQAYPGATAKITAVNCVETGDTQQYNCHVHFTLTSPDGSQTLKMVQTATGSCDNKTEYHCLWQGTGQPVQDNSDGSG